MKNEKCPCCGKNYEEKGDTICMYCGWDDGAMDRGDLEGGANKFSLNKSIDLVKQGKNVDGGTLPWSEWYDNNKN